MLHPPCEREASARRKRNRDRMVALKLCPVAAGHILGIDNNTTSVLNVDANMPLIFGSEKSK